MRLHPMPMRLLYESGLLFEVNRRVLHPFGLALVVEVDAEDVSKVTFGGVQTVDDVDGIVFADDVYREGMTRLAKFRSETGDEKLHHRYNELGYVVQGTAGLRTLVDEQVVNGALWAPATTSLEARLQQELRRLHSATQSPELED